MPEDIFFGATADHLDIRHSHWMCGTHFETEKLSILHNNPSFQIVIWNHIYDEVPTVNFNEGSLHQKCVLKRGRIYNIGEAKLNCCCSSPMSTEYFLRCNSVTTEKAERVY